MSIFEIAMLLCFGAAWPFSIYRSFKSKSVEGKSLMFLLILIAGYAAGILHKSLYSYDMVIYLYIINLCMVIIDTALYLRNINRVKNAECSCPPHETGGMKNCNGTEAAIKKLL